MSYNPLKIGSYTVPTADKEGYEVIRNKVWSKNTGRSANGTMTGDIVALKYTVRQKISEMTQTQVTALVTALSASAFFTVNFTNEKGQYTSGTFYAADTTYKTKIYRNGSAIYTDIQIELIEQ